MNSPDVDLIEPEGEGADLFEAPTTFFLTHRESIERWYALKRRADDAVHQYLLSFVDDIEDLGEQQGLQSGIFEVGRQHHCLLLWPPATPLRPDDAPPIGIGLSWKRGDVAIDGDHRAPCVGVRTGRGSDTVREAFLTAGDPDSRRLRQRHGYDGDRPWPVFRYVTGETAWWADLDGYRVRVMNELRDVVDLFRDRVDEAAQRAQNLR